MNRIRRNHAGEDGEQVDGLVAGKIVVRPHGQSSTGADRPDGGSDGEDFKRLARTGTHPGLHPRRRGKHLERSSQTENLDLVEDLDAGFHSERVKLWV
jgi:hypothetical protein